jgi:hypothetical protein
MTNETIRIRTTPNDGTKVVNIELNQKFDFIEILSLKISQEDTYRRFCSDYGVVVGRVTVNSGFGVPNAKISIFIPISDEDKAEPLINGLYPYSAIDDKNQDGYRYNLLPKNNETTNDCFTQTGSFFNKREFQDNDEALDIYCKYYKYTTVSNTAGDYMFFGVPNGSYLIHVDADISDIGVASQKPYDMAREGANDTQFYSKSKFKKSENLDTLSQIKTKNGSVNVVPFWGDTEQCSIGITRFDVDLATNITPSAIFIGSIFGDNNKNSVNKRCKPRRKVGALEGMTTGSGVIEMIRKTPLNETERFDVNGGQLIDDNGTWAYQVPMNLDYVVTDEFGNLIPSDNPNKGIPTRARVRFRIGMDATGGEGRIRTRAKYLVPHNPSSWSDSDYNFDENTRDKHFQDFHWNKIYSIANHVTRVQSTIMGGATNHRTFTAIKEVDNGGNNNQFPFNKMDVTLNPLFVILCVIVKIIAIIVKLINQFMIPAINAVFYVLNKFIMGPICKLLNWIVGAVCKLRHPFDNGKKDDCIRERSVPSCLIDYIGYMVLSCSADETGKPYCIGCDTANTGNGAKESLKKTKEKYTGGFYFPGSNNYNKWGDTLPTGDAGWVNCIALALAEALDVFKFDFYNDWVNGSLYSFLLKYKVRRKGKGKEKFCEIDCGSTDGVDNNKDGQSDNDCFTNYIVDICTIAVPQGTNITSDKVGESANTIEVKEGLIKKYKDQLYYAAYSKKSNYRLYATKIVCLGAVFDCDWQGLPSIHKYLVDTSYNKPPLINVYHDSGPYTGDIMETGFDSPDNKLSNSQICNINCTSLGVGSQQCNNIKRLCELGVNSDDDNRDDGGSKADFKILNADISNTFIRGAFAYVNGTFDPTPLMSNKIQLIPFDLTGNEYQYNHKYYDKFRGIRSKSDLIWTYENSFYFYFGLLPGKTAITRLKTDFFPDCIRSDRKEMSIVINDIIDDSNDGKGIGSIDISVNGGVGPYLYQWEGPLVNGSRVSCCYDGASKAPCNNTLLNCPEGLPFTGLYGGTYTITVTDSSGTIVTTSVNVGGFIGVECEVRPSPITAKGNGNIYINLSHGTAPYNITIQKLDANGIPIIGQTYTLPPIYSTPTAGYCYGDCTNQPLSEGEYIMIAKDSGSSIKTECNSNFTIIKPETLIIDVTHTSSIDPLNPNITPMLECNGNEDGSAEVSVEGGTPPYTFEYILLSTTNIKFIPKIGTVISTSSAPTNLVAGTYNLKVTDLGGNTTPNSFTIKEPPPIIVNLVKKVNVTTKEGDNGFVSFNIYGSNQPFTIDIEGNESFTKTVTNSGDLVEFFGLTAGFNKSNSTYKPYKITVTDNIGCTTTSFYQGSAIKYDFIITQPGGNDKFPIGLTTHGYVDYAYATWQGGSPDSNLFNYNSAFPDKYGTDNLYDTISGNVVYRHKMFAYGSGPAEDIYHVRVKITNPNTERYWIGLSCDTAWNSVFKKPYYGGWLKLGKLNSQCVDCIPKGGNSGGWGRQFNVYASRYEGSTGTWIPKINDIIIEVSDNQQLNAFNVSKNKIRHDLSTWDFDGDKDGTYGTIDSTTGVYLYYNQTNGPLIDELGNTILKSPNSPLQ